MVSNCYKCGRSQGEHAIHCPSRRNVLQRSGFPSCYRCGKDASDGGRSPTSGVIECVSCDREAVSKRATGWDDSALHRSEETLDERARRIYNEAAACFCGHAQCLQNFGEPCANTSTVRAESDVGPITLDDVLRASALFRDAPIQRFELSLGASSAIQWVIGVGKRGCR